MSQEGKCQKYSRTDDAITNGFLQSKAVCCGIVEITLNLTFYDVMPYSGLTKLSNRKKELLLGIQLIKEKLTGLHTHTWAISPATTF